MIGGLRVLAIAVVVCLSCIGAQTALTGCGNGGCLKGATCNADNQCCTLTGIQCITTPCPSEYCTEPATKCGAGYCNGDSFCQDPNKQICCRFTGIVCIKAPCPESLECFPAKVPCGANGGYCSNGSKCNLGKCCLAGKCTKPITPCGKFGGVCVPPSTCKADGDPIGNCCTSAGCTVAPKPCGGGFCLSKTTPEVCQKGKCCPIFTSDAAPTCTTPVPLP